MKMVWALPISARSRKPVVPPVHAGHGPVQERSVELGLPLAIGVGAHSQRLFATSRLPAPPAQSDVTMAHSTWREQRVVHQDVQIGRHGSSQRRCGAMGMRSLKWKVLPWPRLLSSARLPPSRPTKRLEMASPARCRQIGVVEASPARSR